MELLGLNVIHSIILSQYNSQANTKPIKTISSQSYQHEINLGLYTTQFTQNHNETVPHPQVSPGGSASPPGSSIANPESQWFLMCRLAAPSCPPGDFWARTHKCKTKCIIRHRNSSNSIRSITGQLTRIKTIKNNSPYLDSLLNSSRCAYPFTKPP